MSYRRTRAAGSGRSRVSVDHQCRDRYVASLFRRRRQSRGPFLLMDRGPGLALDKGFGLEGDSPVLWRRHALPHQLWYFRRTEYRDQFQIVSVANGLALDARTGRELPRQAVKWSRHGEAHQRWRLLPTEDGAASFVQSVRTGHVLDVPWGSWPGDWHSSRSLGNARWGEPAVRDRDAVPWAGMIISTARQVRDMCGIASSRPARVAAFRRSS